MLLLSLMVAACTGAPQGPVLQPLELRVLAGEGGSRLPHTHTGPTWADPDLPIGDLTWRAGDAVAPPLAEPAAVVAGSPLRLALRATAAQDGRIEVTATATAEHAPERPPLALGAAAAPVTAGALVDLLVETPPLPAEVGVWRVDLEVAFEPRAPDGEAAHTTVSQRVAQLWSTPIEGTPLYTQSVVWAASWAAGLPSRAATPPDGIEAAEDEIARRMLAGHWTLGEQGHSYGAFPRPKEKDNQAHVFLDFPRSACGELRGFLMSVIEAHGVDARWVMLIFQDRSRDRLSMYETRDIAALGTASKVWRHYNHVAVEVNGRVYDPTYDIEAEDFAAYEDDLFARYCYGEDEPCGNRGSGWCKEPRPDALCVDNPPGYDPETAGFTVKRGDNY
ncbi:MAG: hypothetical protein H6739_18110 [Alphaproteobacteria bacterium]|nr:hypothetical protein [Alphaproteobacteria bacterium]